MTAIASVIDERADQTHAEDEAHIVGALQHWLDRLGLKIPRALCGELLVAGPGYVENPSAPLCPRCAELAGRGGDRG
jgi:hypothetical protein